MPTRVYKNHLIVVSAKSNRSGTWTPVIDISWDVAGTKGSRKVDLVTDFDTREEAETYGIQFATDWIDKNPQ